MTDHSRAIDQAADELERLTRELANARAVDIHSCHAACTRAGCVAAGLRAERDALREDAERYRKWRADYTGTEHSEMLIALADAWEPAQVDAVIDAARKATP